MIDRINVQLDTKISETSHHGEILPHRDPDSLVITTMEMLFWASLDQGWCFKVPEEVERTDGSEALWEDATRKVQNGLEEEAIEDILSIEIFYSL